MSTLVHTPNVAAPAKLDRKGHAATLVRYTSLVGCIQKEGLYPNRPCVQRAVGGRHGHLLDCVDGGAAVDVLEL